MFDNHVFLRLFGTLACLFGATIGFESIVGGHIARSINRYGYQASLIIGDDMQLYCGGGIIANEFVLTAAHCCFKGQSGYLRDTRMSILVGTIDKNVTNYPALMVGVTQFYVPIEYDPKKFLNPGVDIAILKLAHSVELSTRPHLKKLNLPPDSNMNYAGKTAVFAGFGFNWYDANAQQGGHSDSKLRFTEADILDRCDPRFANNYRHTTGVICAQVKQYDHSRQRGVCHEDSGGPLVYDKTVIGILSLCVQGCSENRVGSFYTSVSHHLEFIKHAMDYERNKYRWDIQEYHLH